MPCAPLGGKMIEENKIPLAVKNFVERFGKDAPAQARKRAEELRDVGNKDGYDTWILIYEKVRTMVEDESPDTLH